MKHLVFLLEEKSAVDLLVALWPRLVPPGSEVEPKWIAFEGKQDLEKEIPRKIKGYQNPEARFLIIRDQDKGNCRQIKQRLVARCRDSAQGRLFMVRIVCRELENWYLAQLAAVEKSLNYAPDARPVFDGRTGKLALTCKSKHYWQFQIS
ncbi:hypothetical protein FACS189460_1480 [Deltaproteobacteria bacterium]|nr:hypothetical protein FACS189460_1480 [Deltaproteobacteria bacterium]